MFYILGLLIILLLYMRIEAGWLKVEHISIECSHSFSVAIVSDLHPRLCKISASKVKNIVTKEKPDLFLFLGDAVDTQVDMKEAVNWLGYCSSGIPSYAVLGNHDHQFFKKKPRAKNEYHKALQDVGITLVLDQNIIIKTTTFEIQLTGLDDYQHHKNTFPSNISNDVNRNIYHLLMTHNPQRLVELPMAFADFAVAGHFHGGQIWMPFGLEFRIFRKEPLGKIGVRRGLHIVNGIPLYLSRGIGNVVVPLRLGARPEITILHFGEKRGFRKANLA